jgi:hypothetical protein
MTDNPKCLFCGNEKLAEIKYGYPTPIMIDRARKEEIALGGLNNVGFTHYCYSCNEVYPTLDIV